MTKKKQYQCKVFVCGFVWVNVDVKDGESIDEVVGEAIYTDQDIMTLGELDRMTIEVVRATELPWDEDSMEEYE